MSLQAASSLQKFQPTFCGKHLFTLCPSYHAHLIHLDSSSKFSKGNTHRKYPARRSTALTQAYVSIRSSVILFNHLSCDSHRPVMTDVYIYVITSPSEKTFFPAAMSIPHDSLTEMLHGTVILDAGYRGGMENHNLHNVTSLRISGNVLEYDNSPTGVR